MMLSRTRQAQAQTGLELIAAAAAAVLAYALGFAHGRAGSEAARAAASLAPQQLVIEQAAQDVQRSARTGRARAADSAHVDAFFHTLTEEARRAPPDPVDRCELPAERLRLWTAANAGSADSGTATAERDGAASAPSATGIGPDGRPGGQPPRGGAALSPVGEPDLPAAPVAGDRQR